jgi:proline racemase
MAFSGVIHAVDAHAEGQHGRVVLGGVGVLDAPGRSMFEKMQHFEQEADWFRRFMLKEPRGYPFACVNLVLPPCHPDAQAGYVIMEQPDYYPAMSGSNTIIVATVLLETGVLPMVEPVTELVLEAPAGLIRVRCDCSGGKVRRVTLRNAPSFASHLDAPLEVPGIGALPVDVGYGGMVYVQAEAARLGLALEPDEGDQIVRQALAVLAAAREQLSFRHPTNPDINLIESALLYGPPKSPANSARNAVVLSSGAIDRCPCGTGTSARMAVLHAKGQLGVGQEFRHEGLLDTVFVGRVVEETRLGDTAAVVPEVGGRAWITAHCDYVLAEDDPFPEGFTIGDIWPAARSATRPAGLAGAMRTASG